MTVGSTVASLRWKNAVRMSLSLFRSSFNSSKCKTMAKMAVARVKLLRNKRQVVIKQIRRDIALLLESGQDSTARIRVEHVIREQNVMAANELIELFCELLVGRISIIAKQRECPADLKEGISSLIFAAPRCSEIPELLTIRDVFQKKYGKDFVSAATDLRPNAAVNRMLIEKLSVKNPSGEIKLKVLKEIAKEYQIEWDTKESEMELLKPPEQRIEGPINFVSATSLPLKPAENQSPVPNNAVNRDIKNYEDLASAAGEAAEKAMAAAEAAAALAYGSALMNGSQGTANYNAATGSYPIYGNSPAKITPHRLANAPSFGDRSDGQTTTKTKIQKYSHCDSDTQENQSRKNDAARRIIRRQSYNCESDSDPQENQSRKNDAARRIIRRQSYDCERPHSNIKFDESDCDEEIEMEEPPRIVCQSNHEDARKINRRYSFNVPPAQRNVTFDEYDSDDHEEEMDEPESRINRPPEHPVPHVPGQRMHPKLPDYDTLAARFEALKHQQRRP